MHKRKCSTHPTVANHSRDLFPAAEDVSPNFHKPFVWDPVYDQVCYIGRITIFVTAISAKNYPEKP